MARPESIALAGYFPTPIHLMSRIAGLLEIPADPNQDAPSYVGRSEVSFMDPCAGEGDAILALMGALGKKESLYACEMEATRRKAAEQKLQSVSWNNTRNLLEGDAFRITFEKGDKDGISVLFLNPPYDTDPVHGRLEHKFLNRFTAVLAEGGILLFLVPFYALKASAELLGREYEDLRCFKFPEGDFEVFKQVLLVARKREGLFSSNPVIVEKVTAWSQDASNLPELPEIGKPLYSVPLSKHYHGGLHEWKIRPVDVKGLISKLKPWHQTTKGGQLTPVPGIIPDLPVQDLLIRYYPVATPPRPAHIAAGIASGLFNGARIEPTDASTGLPPLLVKGVFNREFRTVEEKKNKEGEVKAVVQIQQPKLVTTVLDLNAHAYHVLKSDSDESGSTDITKMGVADLLRHYGASLMGVMERQCPIMYDPRRDGDSITLPESPRKLFKAQAHASKALVKILGGVKASKWERKGKAGILLGEIGSGKSTVALMVSEAIKAKRPLIMCPPHLLQSWTNEIASVVPHAEVQVLTTVTELEEVARADKNRTIISILSRETAKLGHGWEGVGTTCPKCGSLNPTSDLAKKRLRCTGQTLVSKNWLGDRCFELALKLAPYAPKDNTLNQLLLMPHGQRILKHYADKQTKGDGAIFAGFPVGALDDLIEAALNKLTDERDNNQAKAVVVMALFLAGDEERIATAVRKAHKNESLYSYQSFGKELLLLLPPGGEMQNRMVEELKAGEVRSYWDPWSGFKDQVAGTMKPEVESKVGPVRISWVRGELLVKGKSKLNPDSACDMLHSLVTISKIKRTGECGEFLFQAVPEPRRIALAHHVSKYYPDLFDLLVLDEGHEYQNGDSAQGVSAHRLTALGIPTILQTGTIMNGYAESLFTNMWSLSPAFRAEFDRTDKQRFIDRYGYRKRLVEDRDKESGEIVEFGSVSDRVTRSERVVGNAPGILPLFLLRHLLPISVTLHKADLAIDLPACKQERCLVQPSEEQKKNFSQLQQALVAKIKKDQFSPELSGRLFGQLAELPSYLDRATRDTGNVDTGDYEIRYPESVGAMLVANARGFDSKSLLPKEEWMLNKIVQELSENRNVMVFSWHVNLLPRLARLISERIGEPVPVLYADKVATSKRQAWIDKEVVKKKRRVMVTNPVAIQTGLNNLVHFASEIWMENPGCNPVIFRQAIGRVDRIGQKVETRIFSPIYEGTLQETLYDLLMKKVAVSVSTDGLDPESALQAAGVGEDDYLAGLSIGKQLWAMLNAA